MPVERVHPLYEDEDVDGEYPYPAGWCLGNDCQPLLNMRDEAEGAIVTHVRGLSGGTYYYDPELLIEGSHWLRVPSGHENYPWDPMGS